MEKRLLLASPHMSDEGYELEYIQDAFRKNWIAPLGENVNEFEKAMGSYMGSGYPVALSAGTAALHLAMILAGVGPGDLVFCQSLTFSASANPVAYCGAKPVFIDSERETWNMDPEALRRAFVLYGTPKAAVAVHLYGNPAKLDEISAVCQEYGVPLIEDAAEALGYHSQIILNGRKVNDSMGAFVADAAIRQMIEAGKAPKKATVVVLGITFKENCPDTRNSKVVDIINRLREYDIQPVVTDPGADAEVAKQVYGVDLVPFDEIPKADCVIVAVGHGEFRALSLMQLRDLFKGELSNDERVLIDVKSLYRMDELKASGLRFWRL